MFNINVRPIAPVLALALCVVSYMVIAKEPLQKQDSPLPSKPLSTRLIDFTTKEFTRPYLDLSPDGKIIYFDLLGEIYRVPAKGGRAEQLELGEGWKQRPMLSPNGQMLAFDSDRNGPHGIWVKSLVSDDAPVPYDVRDNADVVSAAWVSNRDIVTSGRGLYDIGGYSLATSSGSGLKTISQENHVPGAWQAPASMTGSKNGRHIFYLRNGLKRFDSLTGSETLVQGLPEGATQLRLSPDEKRIGFVMPIDVTGFGQFPVLSMLELATGAVTHSRCEFEIDFGEDIDGAAQAKYTFSHDGRGVLFGQGGLIKNCKFDGLTTSIPVSADVRRIVTKPTHFSPARVGPQLRYLAAHPGSTQLSFTARDRIWTLDTADGSVRRATEGNRPEYMPSYSPDGTKMAYVVVENDGSTSLRVRSSSSGAERTALTTDNVLANPAWSPDSKRIAFVESPPNIYAEKSVQIKWRSTESSAHGTFVDDLTTLSNINRFYPAPLWDRAGTGIYYPVYSGEASAMDRQLLHHSIGHDSTVAYELDSSVWDVAHSPSGRFIALMDASGISVAPASGAHIERIKFDYARLRQFKRVTDRPVDYMTWLPDDRLAWSVQDEVFISNSDFIENEKFKIQLPSASAGDNLALVAYVGADIVTMTDQGVVSGGTLVTRGSKIEYVGPPSKEAMKDAKIVELVGKTIIPGLIDVHQHEQIMNRDVTPELSQRLFDSAAYGVTTVFDPSYTDIDGSVLRERSSADGYDGATFYTSGAPLLGGSGNAGMVRIDSYEDAEKFIQRKAQAGSIVVKDYLQPTRNQRRWAAQAARAYGLGITGHERNDIGTQMSMIVDGYNALEHTLFGTGGRLYGDIRKFMAASGISITPTVAEGAGSRYMYARNPPNSIYGNCLIENVDARKLKSEEAAESRSVPFVDSLVYDMAKQYSEMLNDGAHVTIGAHTTPDGLGTHWEMWVLGMAGATPMNVLRAATVYGAQKLSLEDRIGSLGTGMDADFVVLNTDPLVNIRNTTDIYRVVRRGRTLHWPAQSQQPTTWTMKSSWDECRKWNLGVPGPDAPE